MSVHHALAEARENLVKTTEKAEQAHAAQSQLLTRKSAAEAASAEALRAARANGDPDGRHALAMKIADADASDLTHLIAQGAAVLQRFNQELTQAQAKAKEAEQGAKRVEWQETAVELDKSITQIEQTLIAALAERSRINRLLDPVGNSSLSLFKIWKPDDRLVEAVNRFIVPRV